MSALDQALIRVYTQQPLPTAAAPHEGLRAVPLAEALADPPKPQDQRPPLTPDTVLDVLAQPAPKLPEVPPANTDLALPPGGNELTAPQPPLPHFVKPKPAKSRKSSKAAPTLEDLQMPDLIYRVDTAVGAGHDALGGNGLAPSPHLHIASSGLAAIGGAPSGTLTADTATGASASAPAGPSEPRDMKPAPDASGGLPHKRPGAASTPGAVGSPSVSGSASAAQATATVDAAGATGYGALSVPAAAGAASAVPAPHYATTQAVDGQSAVAGPHLRAMAVSAEAAAQAVSGASAGGFVLPEACARLLDVASEQVDRLCDALCSARLQGRKVISLAAYRRREGTTTVLLCAAQRLAERGLRVAVVEADTTGGQLAKTLRLEPRCGWDAALAGQASLESVLIRSSCGRLSLLPWSGSEAANLDGLPDSALVADHLSKLADEHKLVLMDCASLEEQGTTGGFLVRCVGKRLDGLVLVHNPNFTSRERIADVQRRLTAAGVFHIGVVQNLARKR